jgi:membrane protein implicated in regulation of membrane protease activity
MSFGELLTHAQVWPFSLLLLLFFAVSLLEIIMVFSGASTDLGLDLSADIEMPDISADWRVLDWLGLGRVPYLISIAASLFCVGVIGLFVQTLQLETVGVALAWPFVMVGSVLLAVPPVRLLNHGLGRIWPKDVESSAVTTESFIGHEAEVVLGSVSADDSGQIKFRDAVGTLHYAMAYSDRADETYRQGDAVLIVGRRGAFYTVILHPNPSRPAKG